MKPLPLLAALLLTTAMAACATPVPPAGGLARMERDVQLSAAGQGRSPYGLFLAGQAALKSGRSEEAAGLFARARAGEPQSTALRARAFTAALTAGEVVRAARLAAELTPADGQTAELGRVTRAVDLLSRDRGREAQALLAQAGTEPPHALAAEILKPWAAASVGDLRSALEGVPLTAAAAAAQGAEPGARGASLAQLAATLNGAGRLDLLERAGRFGEADALAANAVQGGPSPRQALKIGAYLERRRRHADAVALYQSTLAGQGTHKGLQKALERARTRRSAPPMPALRAGAAEAMMIPASALAGGRQYESALAYARLALHLDPKLDDGWLLLGEILGAAGDVEGARQAFGSLRPESDAFAGAQARLALLLKDQKRDAEALQTIRAAALAAPDDSAVLTTYSALLRESGRPAEAAAVFDRALASETGRRDWRLWFLRGAALESAGRTAEAESDMQRALQLAPDEPEVLNGLGYGWIDRGQRLTEALAMVQRAAELRPRSGAIVDSLGWAYYRLGRYPEAVTQLERAVELEPGDPTINDHLGDAYWRAGRKVEAQFQWSRALTLEPEPAVKAAAQAKLASPLGPDVIRPTVRAADTSPAVR